MNKAFDTVLQQEVDASVIAKMSSPFSRSHFRYQCLCCGKEVYLAAADSKERVPHFKHQRGNDDTDCERYLGKPGAIEHFVHLRKNKQEHISFYFNKSRKTFEICAIFTEEELQLFGEENSKMRIYSSSCDESFLSIPLNRGVIVPNEKNYFTITEFSTDYIIAIDNSKVNKSVYYDVMRTNNAINIYKVGSQGEHCKHLATLSLYTDVQYIAISEKKELLQELVSLEYVESETLISFVSEDKIFYELQFFIKQVGCAIQHFFSKYGYQIEKSEVFNILWPPIYTKNSRLICAEDVVYASSSFELVSHHNISVESDLYEKLNENVLKLCIDNEIVIHEKNINVCIQKKKSLNKEIIPEEVKVVYSDKYTISDEYDYFLFDQNGCTRLLQGEKVYLSNSDRIVGYKNGHIKIIVYSHPKVKRDTRQFINDILKYHPQSEDFKPDEFMDITADEVVLSYLENCYRSGRVNTVLKHYIKGDLI